MIQKPSRNLNVCGTYRIAQRIVLALTTTGIHVNTRTHEGLYDGNIVSPDSQMQPRRADGGRRQEFRIASQ